jgi:hypothetical protein
MRKSPVLPMVAVVGLGGCVVVVVAVVVVELLVPFPFPSAGERNNQTAKKMTAATATTMPSNPHSHV